MIAEWKIIFLKRQMLQALLSSIFAIIITSDNNLFSAIFIPLKIISSLILKV